MASSPHTNGDELPDLAGLAKMPFVPEHELRAYMRTRGAIELTEPELMALRYVSRGLQGKEIAVALGKSTETVKDYLTSARYKLRAKNSAHAACEAIRRGLIP